MPTRIVVNAELAGQLVPVTVVLDADALAAIADAIRDAVRPDAPRWLYGDKAAADYLGWPLGRVQKLSAAGRLPCHRIGQRKTYNPADLKRALLDE